MEKNTELETVQVQGEAAEKATIPAEDKTVVTFKKPYQFEGTEYKEIDLTEIENLTADSLVDAERIYNAAGGFSMMPEMSPLYAFAIASKATKLPLEFFRHLPIKDGLLVKNTVVGFLNN